MKYDMILKEQKRDRPTFSFRFLHRHKNFPSSSPSLTKILVALSYSKRIDYRHIDIFCMNIQ